MTDLLEQRVVGEQAVLVDPALICRVELSLRRGQDVDGDRHVSVPRVRGRRVWRESRRSPARPEYRGRPPTP